MSNDFMTDEEWFRRYTDVSNHQYAGLNMGDSEIIELTEEVVETVDNATLINEMIADSLKEEIEVTSIADLKAAPLEEETEEISEEIPSLKTTMNELPSLPDKPKTKFEEKKGFCLRCTNDDCTSTPRLISFTAGCKLPPHCSICGSTLRLGKD